MNALCACVLVGGLSDTLRTMARYNKEDENRQGATRLLLPTAVACALCPGYSCCPLEYQNRQEPLQLCRATLVRSSGGSLRLSSRS
jgi:hypothetical protein